MMQNHYVISSKYHFWIRNVRNWTKTLTSVMPGPTFDSKSGKLLLYGKAAFAEDGFSLVKNHVILLVAFVNTVDSLVKNHIIKSVYKWVRIYIFVAHVLPRQWPPPLRSSRRRCGRSSVLGKDLSRKSRVRQDVWNRQGFHQGNQELGMILELGKVFSNEIRSWTGFLN